MRVLHLSPTRSGGVARHVALLVEGQRRRGHQVAVLGVPGSGADFELAPDPRLRLAGRLGVSVRRIEKSAIRALESFRPDLVHLHHFGLGATPEVARVLSSGAPATVATLHDDWLSCARGQRLQPTGERCEEIALGRCAACLLQPEPLPGEAPVRPQGPLQPARDVAMRARLLKRQRQLRQVAAGVSVWLSPSERLAAGPPLPGLDAVPALVRNRTPAPLDIMPRETPAPERVAYLGSLLPAKGVQLLVAAFNQLRDLPIQLSLHGVDPEPNGEFRRALEQLAEGRVRFAGAYPPGRGSSVASRADLVVLPSLWFENAPYVLLEAHAAGVPVLAAGHGALTELVRDGVDGLLVEPSVGAFAEALRSLYDDPERYAALRAGAAKRAVEVTDMEGWLDEIDAAYVAAGAGAAT